jgi:hypothetical protein
MTAAVVGLPCQCPSTAPAFWWHPQCSAGPTDMSRVANRLNAGSGTRSCIDRIAVAMSNSWRWYHYFCYYSPSPAELPHWTQTVRLDMRADLGRTSPTETISSRVKLKLVSALMRTKESPHPKRRCSLHDMAMPMRMHDRDRTGTCIATAGQGEGALGIAARGALASHVKIARTRVQSQYATIVCDCTSTGRP